MVHHKADPGKYDMAAWISERIPAAVLSRVHFLGWGEHTATNRFAHVPNTILAGTLFYRVSFYEALGRCAAGANAEERYPTASVERITTGEHKHHVLQALCRGSVRRSQGEGCPPSRAFIIASPLTGIPQALPEIFPGAVVQPWEPVPRKLRGKVAEAVSYITTWAKTHPEEGTVLTFREVQTAIAMPDVQNFRKRIRDHQAVRDTAEALGLREWGRRTYPSGWLRFDPGAAFPTL